MTQTINRTTALIGFILLIDPRQIKRPHGIAPTRVIPNSSKVTRNPFDNADNTSANIVVFTSCLYFADTAMHNLHRSTQLHFYVTITLLFVTVIMLL